MKTKLLGVVGACMLALTGSAANAATFDINVSFATAIVKIYPTVQDIPLNPIPGFVDPPTILYGTIDITNNTLTRISLRQDDFATFSSLPTVISPGVTFTNLNTTTFSASDDENWTLTSTALLGGGLYGGNVELTATNGLLTFASLNYFYQPGRPFDLETIVYSNFTGTITQTPLPAALPLFATGLGALGLLGWRRKRKAAAVA